MKSKSYAKRIISDGLNIYYWTTWSKDMPENFVVLHPGSSMNHSSLQALEQKLNDRGFPTIILDPRGSGFSDAPHKAEYYSLDSYSSDLAKIVEQEGLEKPSFLGHSFGFMPVIRYIAQSQNAEKITGICASHNFAETAPNKLLFHLFNRVIRYTEYLGSIATQAGHLFKGTQRTYPDQSGLRSDLDVWLSIVDAPFRDIRAHIVSGIEINKWDISQYLKEVNQPMLLIYGAQDPMVRPCAGEYMRRLVGNCKTEIIDGTHSLPVICPDKVSRSLEKYGFP